MKRSGTADLPLHYGKVPPWLYERMSVLGLSIVEAILMIMAKMRCFAGWLIRFGFRVSEL
jgi:hypothetical protein